MSSSKALPDAAYYHRLSELTEGNYKDLTRLAEQNDSWEEAWRSRGGDLMESVESSWEALNKEDISLILSTDPLYPKVLCEIPFYPHALYLRGNKESLQGIKIAIVGTRNASAEGKELARSFAKALVRKGITVVSGLALGIDAAAHEGALEAQGITVGVLGNGVEKPHPRTNDRIAERILKNKGALVSEYPPKTPPLPFRFLERNRIVSGLTTGTLVIEAPERSGSLVTARFALEQNRSVFVVPGAARSPQFKGSHKLIREGAELVTSPEEVLEALGFGLESPDSLKNHLQLSEEEKLIVMALAHEGKPLSVDKITELTHLKAQYVNQLLTFLLLKGAVREDGSGSYSAQEIHTI